MYVGVNVNIMCSVSSSDNRNIVTIETGCQTIGDISFSNPITSTPVIHNIDSEVESENDNDLHLYYSSNKTLFHHQGQDKMDCV